MDSDIEIVINSFINNDTNKKYSEIHRFNSWDICFNVFQDYFKKEKLENSDIDYLALHLGMYLSSWGMMRGSADLLQYSYKIHKPIIEELYNFYKNNILFIYSEYDTNYLDNLKNKICLIPVFTRNLFDKYGDISEINSRPTDKKWIQKKHDTLTTKILLGVFGITPAYDRFFKEGLKKENIVQTFSLTSLEQVVQFYYNNITSFSIFKEYRFPPMKLIDMYFWQLGFDILEEQSKNKNQKTTLN